MATLTLRSSKTLTEFVNLSDEAKTLAMRLKEINIELALLQPNVLEQIGDRRSIMVGKQIRTLLPDVHESIKRTCDDQTAVAHCRKQGLHFQCRTAEYVAPATFSSHVKAGLMPETYYSIEKTPIVVVM